MKRISFDRRFVNNAADGLIVGKVHTIRENLEYWTRFEGKELALFYWEDKPYRSRQIVFCVKRLISVETVCGLYDTDSLIKRIAENDGFSSLEEFNEWFKGRNFLGMGILHFSDLRYGSQNEQS